MEICKRRSSYDSSKSLYSTSAVPSAAGNLTVTFSSQLNQHNQVTTSTLGQEVPFAHKGKAVLLVMIDYLPLGGAEELSPSSFLFCFSFPGAFCGGSGSFAELPASFVPAGHY